ncbi:aldo/keto reductase [Altererythrobacter sp. ZODW24]|uniref:aldo/keto reductase n=1 Tax=Altererythrobacter sp. ZODW24 TaxID=2185142 RepID=UPI000DF741F4|nr:aldo/keto reductase [Altererythrobacter sp. ZODW24]
MWRFAGNDLAAAQSLVEAALDSGINLFDTADIYGFGEEGFGAAEELLGQVFAASPELRSRMVLATKGGITPPVPYDSSPGYLMAALDASLKRLGTERVELWQVHRPDLLSHPHELAHTLENMVTSGKVGAVGVSNFTTAQIAALRPFLTVPLASTQPEFSPLHLQPIDDGQLDQAMQHSMAVLAWSPLSGGRIADPLTGRQKAVAMALDKVASEYDVSRAAVTFSWIMAHPAWIIPIVGSQNAGRIADASGAYKVRWSRSSWYGVLVAARGEPLP